MSAATCAGTPAPAVGLPEVAMTPAARKFIDRLVRMSGLPAGAGFRLTVSAGGCSGLASEFSVESVPRAGDAALDIDGIRLFLPVESRLLLQGATIDFADTPTSTGLSFHTPDGVGCGCSTSTGAGAVAAGKAAAPGVAHVSIQSLRRPGAA